jgi:hypothetical protein
MRVYALLFGALATLGLGCAAQVAVRSSGIGQREASPLWYGGMLETVTIVGDGSGGPAVAILGAPSESQTTRCHEPDIKSRRVTTDRRPEFGVAM